MSTASADVSRRRAIGFLNWAHALDHFVILIFPTVVIGLELVYARPYGYGDDARESLWSVLDAHSRCPTLMNVECGHTDPMLTLPFGQTVRLDADARTFETLEAPTAPKG